MRGSPLVMWSYSSRIVTARPKALPAMRWQLVQWQA